MLGDNLPETRNSEGTASLLIAALVLVVALGLAALASGAAAGLGCLALVTGGGARLVYDARVRHRQ